MSGSLNVVVDLLSSQSPISNEQSLDNQSFLQILLLDPTPEIDMFATHWNHKLKAFVSPMSDQKAIARDAFLID